MDQPIEKCDRFQILITGQGEGLKDSLKSDYAER